MAKRDQSFPDPSLVKDEKEFTYQAMVTSVYKKVIAEILIWVEDHKARLADLQKKQEGKSEDPFEIGKE